MFCLSYSYAGQAGFVVMGIRDVKKAILGDIFYKYGCDTGDVIPHTYGFKQPTPMVEFTYQYVSRNFVCLL